MSLNYEESQDTLYCTVLRARDLPAIDAQGLSDPFCKINIITEETIRHTRWQKTRIAHRSVNPEFNEAFTFIGMSIEDISNSQLYVVILDDDKYGNDFLGAAKVALGPVISLNKYKYMFSYFLYQPTDSKWTLSHHMPVGC